MLVFTEIINIVDLLGQPIVVIVAIEPAYCCHCSSPRNCAKLGPIGRAARFEDAPNSDDARRGPTTRDVCVVVAYALGRHRNPFRVLHDPGLAPRLPRQP